MKESSSQFCEFGGNVRKKNKKIFVMHTTMLADKTLSEYIRYTSIVKEKDVILIIPFKISSLLPNRIECITHSN